MIEEEDKARRLARAICSDIMLYNEKVKDAPVGERGALIGGPVQEGRELFTSRVSPALLGVFETAIAEHVAEPLGISPGEIFAPVVQSAPAVHEPTKPIAEVVPVGGPSSKLVIVAGVIFLAIALAAYLLRH